MKLFLYRGLLVFLAFFYAFVFTVRVAPSPVLASAPLLNTPLPTLTQISTPVLQGSMLTPINNTCSNGLPLNYGTLTPSGSWLAACGQCLPSPMPSASPAPSATPVMVCGGSAGSPNGTTTPVCVTGTPPPPSATAPAISPTTPPTNAFFLWGGACPAGVTCTQINSQYWHFQVNDNSHDGNASWAVNLGYTLAQAGTIYLLFHHLPNISAYHNSSAIESARPSSWVGDMVGTANRLEVTWISVPQLISGNPAGNTGYYEAAGSELWTEYSFTRQEGTTNNAIGFRDTPEWNTVPDFNRIGQEFWASFTPLDAPQPATATPLPFSTPIAGSMCSSIMNTSSNSTSPWRMGDGGIIAQECFNTPSFSFKTFFMSITSMIDLFVVDLEGLYEIIPDVGLETVMICFRVKDYSLYMFGILIPLPQFVSIGVLFSALGLWVGSLSGISRIIGHSQSRRF